jgi:hypothetical protein
MVNNSEICSKLVASGADPYDSACTTELLEKNGHCNDQMSGAPSALALAAVYGHSELVAQILAMGWFFAHVVFIFCSILVDFVVQYNGELFNNYRNGNGQ